MPALRPEACAAGHHAMELPASVITADTPMTALELQEAYRALKGVGLRVEVYSGDDSQLAPNPYSITETNYTVERDCRRRLVGEALHCLHRSVLGLGVQPGQWDDRNKGIRHGERSREYPVHEG